MDAADVNDTLASAALSTGLAGTTVLILGLGASGLAMARWCTRSGATVRVWDSRAAAGATATGACARAGAEAGRGANDGAAEDAVPAAASGAAARESAVAPLPNAAVLAADCPGALLFGGDLNTRGDGAVADPLHGVARIFKSPGLSPLDARIAPLLQRAHAAGKPVQGELDLFVQALAALRQSHDHAPKVVAITGTNGKTTTTALTALLVERAGRNVAVAGNIGPTLLDTLTARLVGAGLPPLAGAAAAGRAARQPAAALATASAAAVAVAVAPASTGAALPDVWVLELSSFQLDGVTGFDPTAAAVLNISQDHLDWHGKMAAYTAAKARVFGEHTLRVVNRDDAAVEAMVRQPSAPAAATAPSSARAKPRHAAAAPPPPPPVLRFGTDAPRRAGDFGIVTQNGMAWLVRAQPAEETTTRRRGSSKSAAADASGADSAGDIQLQLLMPADALRIRGRHNAANALAALALATAVGCPLAPLLHALRDYEGEPHRVQPVARIGDVDAYDDSKGTNVGATVAALEGLGADKSPARLVVILGGDGKGQDFAPLAAAVRRQARAVATIGRDAPAIEAALADAGVPLQRHATLEAAVRWCFEQAQAGDAVLLSPACASFDMFSGYAHRAAVFAAAVQQLAAERGQA